jgi:hypothetical protein
MATHYAIGLNQECHYAVPAIVLPAIILTSGITVLLTEGDPFLGRVVLGIKKPAGQLFTVGGFQSRVQHLEERAQLGILGTLE